MVNSASIARHMGRSFSGSGSNILIARPVTCSDNGGTSARMGWTVEQFGREAQLCCASVGVAMHSAAASARPVPAMWRRIFVFMFDFPPSREWMPLAEDKPASIVSPDHSRTSIIRTRQSRSLALMIMRNDALGALAALPRLQQVQFARVPVDQVPEPESAFLHDVRSFSGTFAHGGSGAKRG
jgi:hypothetical protein